MHFALFVMTPLLSLCLWAGTILFGFATGYAFGYSVPEWSDDTTLDDVEQMGRTYFAFGPFMRGGCLSLFVLSGLSRAVSRSNYWPTITWAVFAGVCIILLFRPDPEAVKHVEIAFLLHKPLWAALLAAVVGYVIACVTDKGPVGPLQ